MLRLGSRRQKVATTALLICWIAAASAQVRTGEVTVRLIVGDVIFSLWLLWFAWRKPEWWIWALLAIQAARLMLHALAYGAAMEAAYTLFNNGLSLVLLAALAAAALLEARRAKVRA